ncbi:MAG TPA: 50S ribosomal protein L5 [Nevskiaceae bacterium]|nr:50S ribosomal protein L5 [Nevskiaceae bacterium]
MNKIKRNQIKKVIVSMGVGEGVQNKAAVEAAGRDIMTITGQKPKVCRARVSISEFKLIKGTPIGLKVTLRGRQMEAFLQKLFRIALPRLRDFQGLSIKSFDGQGNYNLGITEQIVFPEIDTSKIDKVRGLQVTIVTNTDSDKEAQKLLEELGMPFEHG